jgi:hypothetical protein
MNYVIMYILVDDLNQFCFQVSMKKQSLLLGVHVLLLGVHVLLPGVDKKQSLLSVLNQFCYQVSMKKNQFCCHVQSMFPGVDQVSIQYLIHQMNTIWTMNTTRHKPEINS